MEARQLLAEETRRSVADRSFVGALVNKWKDFLEGIPDRSEQDRYTMGVTAMLYENESQYLQNMNEETKMVNVGQFTKFIFPVLRRVFPNLIANDIVSVQPMTAPVGAVFYLDYVYGTSKGGTKGSDQYGSPSQGGTAGVFPKDFDRDYTSEYVNGEAIGTGDGAKYFGAGAALDVTFGFNPVRAPNADRGFKVTIAEVNTASGAIIQSEDGTLSGGTVTWTAGTLTLATGALVGFKFQTSAPVLGNVVKAFYWFDGEMKSANVPQMNLDVRKVPVEAVPRRLKAMWSSEAAEDLRAFHGIDAETEIVSSVAQEIALEIDREIIQDLFKASTSTSATFDRIPGAGIAELDHLRGMLTQIASVSNAIHKKTLRAPANFIVTSPEVSALFAQLTTHGDFRPIFTSGGASPYGPADMPRPLANHGQYGIYKVGTLMNKWMVYEDPFFSRDQMLIGLKGGSYLDAGYVWAPYVPLQVTPTFLDPSDFSFRKGLRTRYASKLLRPEYYGQLRITNL